MTTLSPFMSRLGSSASGSRIRGGLARLLAKPILALLLLPLSGNAQVSVDWAQGPGGVTVAGDGLGNVYTARNDSNPAGDIQIIKHDSAGILQWQAGFDQTDLSKWEQAMSVNCDPAGNVVVCGTLKSGQSNPVNAASILMKFSPTGSLLWRVVYDGAFDGSSTRRCLVDGDGIIYVLGLGMGPNGLVTRVKAFNPDGGVRWNWFDPEGIGAPLHFKFSPDRGILVYFRSITGSLNGFAKIDLAGNLVWSLPGIFGTSSGDLAGDRMGNTYLVHGESPPNSGTALRKLDPAGSTIWSVSHPFGGFRVEVGHDDLPVACGYTTPASGGAAFVKFDSTGGVVWQNLNADGNQNLLLHSQLLLDNRNNAYLAAGTLFQMAVCKVNHDGSNGWLYLGSGNAASAIALGPAGRIYATGIETVQLGQAYDPLPAKLQLMRIAGMQWVTVSGEIGQTYELEVSDDLDTWTPFVSPRLTTDSRDCADPGAAGKRSRFYRIAPAN